MKLLLSIFLFTLSFSTCIACDCNDFEKLNIAREKEYNYSDVIFIGEIIALSDDSSNFQIKVLELFKGDIIVSQTLVGINNSYCTPYINKTGKWLIYGNLQNGELRLNICGLSRSFETPYHNHHFIYIPEPPKQIDSTYKSSVLRESLAKKEQHSIERAFIELENELEMLRNK